MALAVRSKDKGYYGLDGPGIESRWGAMLSALVQTSPGCHPAFYKMGTGLSPGVM